VIVRESGKNLQMMSTADLQGKTILVTGAAKRVGAVIARGCTVPGAYLTLHYHASEREAHALQSELNLQRANSVMLVKADLLETAGLAEIVKTCVERFGSLDALVNNAWRHSTRRRSARSAVRTGTSSSARI